jgi:hypothetical protein
MTALNATAYAAMLKELYPSGLPKDLIYKDNPLLAILPKDSNAGGESVRVPIRYGNPQGRSATFATAVSNKTPSKYKAFLLPIPFPEDYGVISIDRQTVMAARGNNKAFADAQATEIEGIVNAVSRSLAKSVYGSGSGRLGKVASVSTTDVVLADINDITNFEVGMVLVVSTADGGGSLETGSVTVAGIDENTGTITASANWSAGISTIAANQYIFQQGDYDEMLSGLAAWVPETAPGATAFFGVDRSAHVTRLGGIRHDGSSQTVEEALLSLMGKVSRAGGRVSHIFLNDVQVDQLIKSLGSNVEYDVVQAFDAEVGFNSIRMRTPSAGVVQVMGDYNCPATRGYALNMDTWKLYSVGEAPHIFDFDNDQKVLREASSDSYEVRVGYYAQLGCTAPGWNGVVTLQAATF